LGRTPGAAAERLGWLYERGQYRALLQVLDGRRPRPHGGKRRGMMPHNRLLAARALALKKQGISWSHLLAALIADLEAAPRLAAADQVLLARLRALQAGTRPVDSGAYLRLTIARYKAEQTAREADPAA
jgi:hypothetical protein